jgi:hypothetical protein
MNWYYVSNDERKGPVEQVEFDRLAQQGVITQTTLVWREGMAEWRPYSEFAAPPIGGPPPPVVAGGVVCSQCGQIFAPDQVIRLGGGFVCAACKPIATQKLREGVLNNNSAEQIRNDNLKHEASVKSIGFLYFFSATFLLLASFGMGISAASDSRGALASGLLAVVFFGIAAILVWVGIGLRRLRPWARIPSGILSGLGLLGFPLGTLINGYILYLLFSAKGKMVFSPEYQRVIAETPHIKYRTSIVIWILLGLLLLFVGLAMFGLLVRSHR